MVSSLPPESDWFRLDEETAKALAAQFGTPLHVVSESVFRARLQRYMQAARSADPNCELTYATKANSTLALLAIAHQEGYTLDVASEGELRAALAAGVPASACHSHGNNKSFDEIRFALSQSVSHIVVDNFVEIDRIAQLAKELRLQPRVVLRLAPGVNPKTHEKISTGQADTKFGFALADGQALEAVRQCIKHGFDLLGFHCHVGSQLLDPTAQKAGGELIAQFAISAAKVGAKVRYLNVGGGLAARYLAEDQPMEVERYCQLVFGAVRTALDGSGLVPRLAQEPGRSLIAEAGVTLYTVGVVKSVPTSLGPKRYAVVDGGLYENLRPALYGARYTVSRVAKGNAHHWEYVTDGPGAAFGAIENDELFTVSGRHCETDTLFSDVQLPQNLAEGDLVQVLTTGAYSTSMASQYNRFPRPPVVLIAENGEFEAVARVDTYEEMFARESVPNRFRNP